eukprot:654432-Pyramimonas_sp.AAC.1
MLGQPNPSRGNFTPGGLLGPLEDGAHRGFKKAPLRPFLTTWTPRKLSSSNSNALANTFHACVNWAQALLTG